MISPDPTRQSATGVPTRLAFGLEEVYSQVQQVFEGGEEWLEGTAIDPEVVAQLFTRSRQDTRLDYAGNPVRPVPGRSRSYQAGWILADSGGGGMKPMVGDHHDQRVSGGAAREPPQNRVVLAKVERT